MTELAETKDLLRESLSIAYSRQDGNLVQTITTADRQLRTFRVDNFGDSDGDIEGDWWLDFLRGQPEHPERITGDIRAIDLFCGAGGLSIGASLGSHALGRNLVHEFAADSDEQSLGIFKTNHKPRFATSESVANLVSYQYSTKSGEARFLSPPHILDKHLLMLRGGIDLLLAGPPCQGNSTANNKTRFNDPRNLLYLAVPAIAVGLDIPALIIENVPGVTSSREGVVTATIQLLQSNGYTVSTAVLKSDRLGWPQTRRRFFLVATKGWEPLDLNAIQESLKSQTRPISWALRDVLNTQEKSLMTDLPKMAPDNQRRIDYLHNHDVYDLPNDQRPFCHQNGTTYRSVYGRLNWNEPAPTLTTGFMTPGRGRYVHPIERRTLLPREAARIQGFPDNYRFESLSGITPKSAIVKGIGDAVPSIFGFVATLAALTNHEIS